MNADATWEVAPEHPAFAGHFPGRPIVPGVLLLDHVLLLAAQHLDRPTGGWSVTQAKFLSPCAPADKLVFALRASPGRGLAFTIRCGGRDVACGNLAPLGP